MAQQDNNKSANISDENKGAEKGSVEQGAKSGGNHPAGAKATPQNQGDKADAKQAAK